VIVAVDQADALGGGPVRVDPGGNLVNVRDLPGAIAVELTAPTRGLSF
jgi:hypothetical protein